MPRAPRFLAYIAVAFLALGWTEPWALGDDPASGECGRTSTVEVRTQVEWPESVGVSGEASSSSSMTRISLTKPQDCAAADLSG